MSSQIITLLFESILAVLLMAAIVYCAKLSRRIRQLQDNRSELGAIIHQFDSATGRAMAALGELQTVSKRITDALQLKIDKANFLADDLAFLIEKSTKIAGQLEQARAAQPAAKPVTKYRFEAGPQLVKPAPAAAPPLNRAQGESAGALSATSLEAVLQRLASGSASAAPTTAFSTPTHSQPPSAPRTTAERELLDALKSGR